jgi:hypothetical protein
MKTIKSLTLAAGILSPVFLFGDFTKTNLNFPPSVFHGTVIGMNVDVSDLYVPESNTGQYNEIAYDPSSNDWWTNTLSTPASKPLTTDPDVLFFEEISPDNKTQFFIEGGASFDIGYFGNENGDLNLLYTIDNGSAPNRLDLFKYDEDGGVGPDNALGPPQSYNVKNNDNFKVSFQFWHEDISAGPIANQSEPKKFKMFQAVEYDEDTGDRIGFIDNEYIFGIDDRMRALEDWDDGFFYVRGDISPVPEPSQIALLSILGLGGFLYLRRRRAARK